MRASWPGDRGDGGCAAGLPKVRHGLPAALCAAVLALTLQLLVMASGDVFPLGGTSRGLGDYGAQYLPFHLTLAQALQGSPLVDLGFNWLAGGGVAFIPDYATYLSSPFALVLRYVPAQQVEAALAWIIVAKLVCAAAAMALLLGRLTPGTRWPVPALFGTGYACSTWVFDLAIYTPQWLDGLLGFPLLCLVGLWCAQRRHRALGVLVVTEVWWANYYTAYMASLAAACFLLCWLAATASRLRGAAASMGRFAVTGVLGVLLAAPLLLPTLLAVRNGTPYDATGFPEVSWETVLARLLPFTEGVALSPALAVGSLPLVLALCLPFAGVDSPSKGLPLRQRLAFFGGTTALMLSILSTPAKLAWNLMDVPNGNPYRFSFVLVGLLLCCAHLALHQGDLAAAERGEHQVRLRWPGFPEALAALTVVVILVRVASTLVVPRTWVGPLALRWPVLTALVVLLSTMLRPSSRRVASMLIAMSFLVEIVLSAGYVDQQMRGYLSASPVADTVGEQRLRADKATQLARWPHHRVGATPWHQNQAWMSYNSGMRLGYPATTYYSSTMPGAVSGAMTTLGVGFRAGGRMLVDSADPGLDPLLGVAVRATEPGFHGVREQAAFPLVRIVPDAEPGSIGMLPEFAWRNALLADPVYQLATDVELPDLAGRGASEIAPGQQRHVAAKCPAGRIMQVKLSSGDAVLTWHDRAGRSIHTRSLASQVVTLSPAPADGFTVKAMGNNPTLLVPEPVGCLDVGSLAEQIRRTEVPQIEVDAGHLTASFAQPVSGDVVVATTAQAGWSCRLDGHRAELGQRSGLLSVRADGNTALECRHHTPGLLPGIALAVLSALATVGWSLGLGRLRRVALLGIRRRATLPEVNADEAAQESDSAR